MEEKFEPSRALLAKAAKRQKHTYDGPFLVIKVIGEVNYLIQKHPNMSPFTVHVDDLKH